MGAVESDEHIGGNSSGGVDVDVVDDDAAVAADVADEIDKVVSELS